MATFFVIFNETKHNDQGVPYLWAGRYGWTKVPLLAHTYLDYNAVKRALKRNQKLQEKGVYYLTADEFGDKYGAVPG